MEYLQVYENIIPSNESIVSVHDMIKALFDKGEITTSELFEIKKDVSTESELNDWLSKRKLN